ncbi:MAG: caspase family protein [Saprospiraceae bacterium]|nr:caspase family protein [Saprospiraceae bacterium]
MLRNLFHILIVTAVSALAFVPIPTEGNPTKPGKFALIVAVGKYPASSGWEQLSSENDVRILRDAFLKQGFNEDHIAVITDRQATRQGILKAIRSHLTERAKPGDVAVFHFSGHGQQVQDDNADEVDGFDEALVPFDSPKHYQPGIYEGQNLIRDEELGSILNELRSKLGPQGHLLTLIDACHSGTATRGLGKARGTDERMASLEYLNQKFDRFGDENSLEANVPGDLAPMVALFSASPNQLSYEYVDEAGMSYGILSYTFSKAFGNIKEGTSYRSLFDQLRMEVTNLSPRQTPQAEGGLSEAVLGGHITGTPRYFLPSEWIDGQTLRLSAGTFAGLHEGTVVVLYPSGIRDTAGVLPLAFGKVTNATPIDCDVELEKSIPRASRSGFVFVKSQNYGNLSVSIRLEVSNDDLAAALRQLPNDCPAIKLTASAPELVLLEQPNKGNLQLLTKDEYVLGTFKLPTSGNYLGIVRQVRQQVVAFAQAKFLRPMEIADKRLGLRLYIYGKEGPHPLRSDGYFFIGTELRLVIVNTGKVPCYFSLLDIQPDNQMNVIIPAGKPAVDYYLPVGGRYEYPELVEVSEPIGTEVLKLIASDQPLDLTNIIQTRGVQGLGKHPFEVLLRQTYLLEGTRGETGNLPKGGLAVSSVVVEIQEGWKGK